MPLVFRVPDDIWTIKLTIPAAEIKRIEAITLFKPAHKGKEPPHVIILICIVLQLHVQHSSKLHVPGTPHTQQRPPTVQATHYRDSVADLTFLLSLILLLRPFKNIASKRGTFQQSGNCPLHAATVPFKGITEIPKCRRYHALHYQRLPQEPFFLQSYLASSPREVVGITGVLLSPLF